MANEEHLAILKQGVEAWNKSREKNPNIHPDLSSARLIDANLTNANLNKVSLFRADLSRANFTEADLNRANLGGTNLNGTNLVGADLNGANFYETIFADVDLSEVKGLDKCIHHGPSTIDHRTLMKSGELPLEFLRGVGLPDDYIQFLASFRNEPFQFYSCFISYSHKDEEIAKRLYDALQGEGVRCWFAPEDMKIGDKTRRRIDDSIRVHDKLLLILSENSIASDWVEYEAERALDQERKRGGTVLFPIRLGNAIMKVEGGWADHIRERHIGDFRNWKDHDSYQKAFDRLMRDLKAEE